MTITVLLDPAQMPDQSQDQLDFDNKMSGLMRDLPTWGAQANAMESALSAFAAGGAYALLYSFDSATSDVDPGPGRLRLSSSGQNVATVMRVDTMSGGADVSSILDTFDASTGQTKGSIRLTKVSDPSKFLLFNVTARSAPTGYRNLTVVCVGGSSANPFANGDALMLFFQRAGDQGASGSMTQVMCVRDEKGSGTGGGDAFGGTWGIRELNTVVKNSIVGASLANNQITLPAGTYRLEAVVPAGGVMRHRSFLWDVTNGGSVRVAEGGSMVGANGVTTLSVIGQCEFTIATTRIFSIAHWTSTNLASTGLGYAAAATVNEIYTQVFIEKVS